MAGVDGGSKELGAGMERRWGAGVTPGRSSRSPVTRGKRERERERERERGGD
jgi:hypothetical protein